MITDNILKEVVSRYGRLFDVGEKGQMVYFNSHGFAELSRRDSNPVYIPAEKKFFHYDTQTGLWRNQSEHAMFSHIGLFLHGCAEFFHQPAIETKRKISIIREILTFLKELAAEPKFFDKSGRIFIHCLNGVLEFNTETKLWELKPFYPDYRSRSRVEIAFDPMAECPHFLHELLYNLIEFDDLDLIQRYAGQCLLSQNITQTLLLITGSGGSGKGVIVRIIEAIVGPENCSQIRPDHISGRFELGFFLDKNLLSGRESTTSFFTAKGMSIIKSLVGDDDLRIEHKMSNEHEIIRGKYNLIIVGNPTPTLKFESEEDKGAWRRRIRWIRCKKFIPPAVKRDFAETLLQEEGPGILNWMLSGARELLLSDNREMSCNAVQTARLDYLFGSAEPLKLFLISCVEANRGTTITSDEMFGAFTDFCKMMEWSLWNQREFQNKIPDAMLCCFQASLRRDVQRNRLTDGKTTNRAGFFHVRFKR